MHIKKITQFQDILLVKRSNKHWWEVQIRFNIFRQIFTSFWEGFKNGRKKDGIFQWREGSISILCLFCLFITKKGIKMLNLVAPINEFPSSMMEASGNTENSIFLYSFNPSLRTYLDDDQPSFWWTRPNLQSSAPSKGNSHTKTG